MRDSVIEPIGSRMNLILHRLDVGLDVSRQSEHLMWVSNFSLKADESYDSYEDALYMDGVETIKKTAVASVSHAHL